MIYLLAKQQATGSSVYKSTSLKIRFFIALEWCHSDFQPYVWKEKSLGFTPNIAQISQNYGSLQNNSSVSKKLKAFKLIISEFIC